MSIVDDVIPGIFKANRHEAPHNWVMALVRVSDADHSRTVMLRESAINITNLGILFRLNQQRLYLQSEENNEVAFPNETGLFAVDCRKRYIVNGDPIDTQYTPAVHSQQSPQSQSLGIAMSYQSNDRGRLNPPPGQLQLKRPKFAMQAKTNSAWKKGFIVVSIDAYGNITENYQIHLMLNEESSTVELISEQLKQQLGFEIGMLDSKLLPVVSCEMTKGTCNNSHIISDLTNISNEKILYYFMCEEEPVLLYI